MKIVPGFHKFYPYLKWILCGFWNQNPSNLAALNYGLIVGYKRRIKKEKRMLNDGGLNGMKLKDIQRPPMQD